MTWQASRTRLVSIAQKRWVQITATVTLLSGIAGALGDVQGRIVAMAAMVPYSRDDVDGKLAAAQVAVGVVVQTAVTNAAGSVSAKIDTLSNKIDVQSDMLNEKIDQQSNRLASQAVLTARLNLANLRSQRPSLEDLRTKNPDSQLLVLQLQQLDSDIADADRMYRLAICDLNRRIIPNFSC